MLETLILGIAFFFKRVVLIFTIQSFQNFLRGQISRAWSVKGNTQQYTDALTTLLSTFFQNCSSVKFIPKALFSPLRIFAPQLLLPCQEIEKRWKKCDIYSTLLWSPMTVLCIFISVVCRLSENLSKVYNM